ncbi:organic hydroperoxide reductase OsmC/OhrA [Psychromicrobium silvestre]|uniref:Organic hydroperoxide reductase OsmC/OhrA n=1 Tax=Psychromicrobium silvestre TaxID=1645614 RepID=A0A7Y9S4P9_9MICC|nr:OsmC family protein [Psychromicrobium silvestre]NYE94533.1 organic hydroperoxide reductase OsmC/OhrA [Psychromicrobium silvestre]
MSLMEHHYALRTEWTGNRGSGTSGYRDYGRDHLIRSLGVPDLFGSADATFHGDKDRWNPELLLLSALSECHMLSYLHVAVNHGVVVTGYTDEAQGTMILNSDGSGQFSSVLLRPRIELADPAQAELALSLHHEASQKCFIARSVNFPVEHEPSIG